MKKLAGRSERKTDEDRTKVRTAIQTGIILFLIFLLALFIRSYFYYEPATAPVEKYGKGLYIVSGNDPDYHKRSIDYLLETGHHLTKDPLMNYPVGGPNPNPPLFVWTSAIMGIIASPFFGFDVSESTWIVFEFICAFWAALTVFPVYFFTRDMFGRKPGYLAAFFIAVMAGNVERTPLGFSDHDSFVVFFVVSTFFFLMRSLKNVENREWVEDWRSVRHITFGLTEFFRTQKLALLYAAMAGMCITAVMLAWKGVAYILAIIVMYYLAHLIINKIRGEDSTSIAFCVLIAMAVPMIISFPYYYYMKFMHWYETPFFVFVASIVLTIFFVPTRDIPWIVLFPSIIILLVCGYYGASYFVPHITSRILGFQGYFIRTKLYETIAEAQPPDFSRLIYSYGVVTFYFALVGVLIMMLRLRKEKWRNDYILTLMWMSMAIYMSVSAVRFMYNATPVFAILSGWITYEIIKITDFGVIKRTIRSFGGNLKLGLKHALKVKHIAAALFLAFLVFAPNIWYGIDAGVPFETKKKYDKKIYEVLPDYLHPPDYDPDSPATWWLGAFGTAFPSDYWVDGMYWFRTQDSDKIPSERPAFVAWWDYGHWCMHMGMHPSLADNFQQGVEIAGNIITAQNESEVIAYFIARLAEPYATKDDEKVKEVLEKYLGKDGAHNFIEIEKEKNLDYWRKEILKKPEIYGSRTSDINDRNVKWVSLRTLITRNLNLEQIVNLYKEMIDVTDRQIRYFAADSRMFPFSARNTGIYYAPVKLTDQNIDHFLRIMAIGNDGVEYDPNNIPEHKLSDPDFRITDYKLYYEEPFYKSLFYKAYIGYGPLDVGLGPDDGIPSIIGKMRSAEYIPLQAWNMTHFRLVYRTSYWNPYKQGEGLENHTWDWKVIPPWDAEKIRKSDEGTLDQTFRNLYQGVFFLKYYHGAYINGTVKTEDGEPMSNVRITVYDDVKLLNPYYPGIPHYTTYTDKNGKYSVLAPFGNVTIIASNGGNIDKLMLKEKHELAREVINISDNQAMRIPEDKDEDGVLDYNINLDLTVKLSNVSGKVYWDVNTDGTYDEEKDIPLKCKIRFINDTVGKIYEFDSNETGDYTAQNITPNDYKVEIIHNGTVLQWEVTSVDAGINHTQDINITMRRVFGKVKDAEDNTLSNISVMVLSENGEIMSKNISQEDGNYTVEYLYEGNYTLAVRELKYNDFFMNLSVPENMTNISVNITLYPSAYIHGKIRYNDGKAAPYAAISIINKDNESFSKTIYANEYGEYGLKLPKGNYSIYARFMKNGTNYVQIRDVYLKKSETLNMTLQEASTIFGTTYVDENGNGLYDVITIIPGPPQPGPGGEQPPPGGGEGEGDGTEESNTTVIEFRRYVHVEIMNENGTYILTSNVSGGYIAHVPPGEYTLYAYYFDEDANTSWVNMSRIVINESTSCNISLQEGVKIYGKVFYDVNENDIYEKNEGIGNFTLEFSAKDTMARVKCADNGSYDVYLVRNREYEIRIMGDGFEDAVEYIQVGTLNIRRNLEVEPSPVLLTLNVSVPNIEINLTLTSQHNESWTYTTDENGSLSIKLLPGNYTLKIDTEVNGTRYMCNKSFTIKLGEGRKYMDVIPTYLVNITGVIYRDQNNNGVPEKYEKMSGMVHIIKIGKSIDDGKKIDSQHGDFSIYLEPGEYVVYVHIPSASGEIGELTYFSNFTAEAGAPLNISLSYTTRIHGKIYLDMNKNGKVDEGEGRSEVSYYIMHNNYSFQQKSDEMGLYEIYVPRGINITIKINDTKNISVGENEVPIMHVGIEYFETKKHTNIERDISVMRYILCNGTIFYDRNENDTLDDGEGVGGAIVKFVSESGIVSKVTSNDTGYYEVYLPEEKNNVTAETIGYDSNIYGIDEISVETEKRSYDLQVIPLNVTVRMRFYIENEQISKGKVYLRNEEGNVTTIECVNEEYVIDVPPGEYTLLSTHGEYIAFEHLSFEPSGEDYVINISMKESVKISGTFFYKDTDGNLKRPKWVNFTTKSENNATWTYNFTERYSLTLPHGNYTVYAEYICEEYGMSMNYTYEGEINTSRKRLDFELKKAMDYSIEIVWDETEETTLDANQSVNYTIKIINKGNEPNHISIEKSTPPGWIVKMVDEIFLDIGEEKELKVKINVSSEPSAGENRVTIKAKSKDDENFTAEKDLIVKIYQHYGVSINASEEKPISKGDAIEYTVVLKNEGNGRDTINLTVENVPYGWNVTLDDYNPVVSGGSTRDVKVTLKRDVKDLSLEEGTTITIRARSSDPSTPEAVYEFELKCPELSGKLIVSGPDVHEPQKQKMPSFTIFEIIAVISAILIISRRMEVIKK